MFLLLIILQSFLLYCLHFFVVLMADVFSLNEAKALLKNKYIVLIGDGNVRSLYKDLVWFLSEKDQFDSSRCCFSQKLKSICDEDRILDYEEYPHSWRFTEHRFYEQRTFRIDLIYMNSLRMNCINRFLRKVNQNQLPKPDLVYFSCHQHQSLGRLRESEILEDLEEAFNSIKNISSNVTIILAKALPMAKDCFKDPLPEEVIYFKEFKCSDIIDYTDLANRLSVKSLDTYFFLHLDIFRGFPPFQREKNVLRYLNFIIFTIYAEQRREKLPGRATNIYLRLAQLSSLGSVREYKNLEQYVSPISNIDEPVVINAKEVINMIEMNSYASRFCQSPPSTEIVVKKIQLRQFNYKNKKKRQRARRREFFKKSRKMEDYFRRSESNRSIKQNIKKEATSSDETVEFDSNWRKRNLNIKEEQKIDEQKPSTSEINVTQMELTTLSQFLQNRIKTEKIDITEISQNRRLVQYKLTRGLNIPYTPGMRIVKGRARQKIMKRLRRCERNRLRSGNWELCFLPDEIEEKSNECISGE